MEVSRKALVICESLAPEIEGIAPPDMEKRVMDFGLHNHPQKLNQKLRQVVAELDATQQFGVILLGYGLCSDGVVGLKSKTARIVVPRTDDCIAIFLGSRELCQRERKKEPGTFYLTKGWIEHKEDPLSVYLGEHESTKKYDKKIAQWYAKEIMRNYKRIALIDTGAYDLRDYEDYARKTAEVFGLDFEIIPGSLEFLKKLLHGPWDEDFVVVEPGQEIIREMFVELGVSPKS
ncbi:MAG: Uncharacterized protein XD63_0920 [Thermoanaerobacterales bacterium 50_218]|nr:MAG: Uncharacterized protein XD63_0920 [Thermoanaerobacterales bacterium 50_218]HAA90029.1 hypothetical protein [Peptococcaceae bacterium]